MTAPVALDPGLGGGDGRVAIPSIGITEGEIIRGYGELCRLVRKSRTQLWRDIRDGRFPGPIELGPNSLAWVRSEIDAFLQSRPRRTYRSSNKSDSK
jgi:predicted DNA-binding transcriptional regulator AlpA